MSKRVYWTNEDTRFEDNKRKIECAWSDDGLNIGIVMVNKMEVPPVKTNLLLNRVGADVLLKVLTAACKAQDVGDQKVWQIYVGEHDGDNSE